VLPLLLFIDGLSLPDIMDNFNTDIFGSQGDVMNHDFSPLPQILMCDHGAFNEAYLPIFLKRGVIT